MIVVNWPVYRRQPVHMLFVSLKMDLTLGHPLLTCTACACVTGAMPVCCRAQASLHSLARPLTWLNMVSTPVQSSTATELIFLLHPNTC